MQLQKFNIIVHGCSAHGSTPHLSKDAIVAASNIILNLQLLISRLKDPLAEEVLTLTQVKSGTQFNIITDRAELAGVLGAADKEACSSGKHCQQQCCTCWLHSRGYLWRVCREGR